MDAGGRATQGAVAEGKSVRPPAAGSWVAAGGPLLPEWRQYRQQAYYALRSG